MIRKCFCIFLIAILLLAISACVAEKPAEEQFDPTFPTFREDLSPLEQLLEAIEKTKAQGSYEIRYGTTTERDGQIDETAQTQRVTPEKPINMDAMRQFLPLVPDRDGFLADFGNQPLRVVPSNTGVLRFMMPDLQWDEAAQLLYCEPPTENFGDALCEIALEVDDEGRLSQFELIMDGEERVIVFITLTFPEGP